MLPPHAENAHDVARRSLHVGEGGAVFSSIKVSNSFICRLYPGLYSSLTLERTLLTSSPVQSRTLVVVVKMAQRPADPPFAPVYWQWECVRYGLYTVVCSSRSDRLGERARRSATSFARGLISARKYETLVTVFITVNSHRRLNRPITSSMYARRPSMPAGSLLALVYAYHRTTRDAA
ncbi:hypothetical protein PsYK624_150780 [Phanerochaete sordida]|uniref:Uncharacterized protein n=1 Tax=Phanerochaete sordida TaxID=48140 RepID=A0A9P3GPL3_9APHY|nr:hypothetical protein PsYK624_150780 [Phanerochaete sordida]